MEISIISRAYWTGFFMCLFIIGVSVEIIYQFYIQVDLEIMKSLINNLVIYNWIFMIGTSLLGMFIIYNLKLSEEVKQEAMQSVARHSSQA